MTGYSGRCRNRRACRRRGFTLVETMMAVGLMGLLFLGAMSLYISALQTSGMATAKLNASSRGAVALERTMNLSRECYSMALSTDSSKFTPPLSGTQASSYVTRDGSAAALQLTTPATAPVSVTTSTGTTKTSGQDFPLTYNHTIGPTLTLYRSDGSGNPAPDTGQYLWEKGTEPGQTALPSQGRMIAKLIQSSSLAASTPDAVQFTDPPTDNQHVEVAIRLTASDYSPGNGRENNEGLQSTIVGKCVLLRNHL